MRGGCSLRCLLTYCVYAARAARSRLASESACGTGDLFHDRARSFSDSTQQQLLEERFTLFWNHSSVVGITLWGYKQGQHWRPDAYLQRYDGSERSALSWLMDFIGR